MASLFTATYPERTRALVLFHPVARGPGTDDPAVQQDLSQLREGWGTRAWSEELLRDGSPTLFADEEYRRRYPDWLRVSASPEVAYALNRAFFETDLRDVYPAVRVPTLVLYRQGAPYGAEADALETAALVPNARTMRVSGSDYFPLMLSLDVVDEIERLVAGEEPPKVPTSVLTTVLFTDLVGSTEHASEVGDRAWSELMQEHHALVRREIARYRGDERDTAGDGFFVTFDGPARAIRAAESVLGGLRTLGLDARAGIHVGECEVHDGKPAGIAVNIGARVAALAGAGEVLVTRAVRDLVAGSELGFDDRGRHRLKGVPGEWELFSVASVG
jgi:class 3 adenylate cyclase